jgi:four helix bundle protein
LSELETHSQITQRLNFLDQEKANYLLEQCAEIGRMLNGLITSQAAKISKLPRKN